MSEEFLKDVRINNKGRKFKFRVAGIIEQNDKVLLVRMNDNKFFCFPGGHVELLEDTAHAVERELNEELYFEVKVENLLYIHENFFDAPEGKYHELCFYYKARPANEKLETIDTHHEEMDQGQLVHHEYKWVDKNDLLNFNARPTLVIEKYVEDDNKFLHLLTNDLK